MTRPDRQSPTKGNDLVGRGRTDDAPRRLSPDQVRLARLATAHLVRTNPEHRTDADRVADLALLLAMLGLGRTPTPVRSTRQVSTQARRARGTRTTDNHPLP